MSDTKFTPGPYATSQLDICGAEWGTSYQRVVLPNGEVWQCQCADMDNWGDREARRATGRLFAASPDLYEALKGLLADIEDYQTINNLGGSDNCTQVAARAALAKAVNHG